jgi:hypothetical protein
MVGVVRVIHQLHTPHFLQLCTPLRRAERAEPLDNSLRRRTEPTGDSERRGGVGGMVGSGHGKLELVATFQFERGPIEVRPATSDAQFGARIHSKGQKTRAPCGRKVRKNLRPVDVDDGKPGRPYESQKGSLLCCNGVEIAQAFQMFSANGGNHGDVSETIAASAATAG